MADTVRTLNITDCKEVYRGNGRNGAFVLYQVEATDEQGVVVNQKLNAFSQLPPGKGRYKVKPYKKNNQIEAYTLEAAEGTATGSAALAQRVEFMEEQIKFLLEKAQTHDSAISDLQQRTQQPATAAPTSAPPPDDDDIPF